MLRIKVLTVGVIAVAALIAAQQNSLSDNAARFNSIRTATSSIQTYLDSNGDPVVETTNAQYKFRQLWIGGDATNQNNYRMATFLETVNCKHNLGLDDNKSTVSVDAWIETNPNATVKTWSIRQDGDSGFIGYGDAMYRIDKFPEADLMPVYTFYSLFSGTRLYTSTQEDLTDIVIPNTGTAFERYAAIHETQSVQRSVEEAHHKHVAGVFQYGSDSKVICRLLIQATDTNPDGFRGRPFKIRTRYQGKVRDENRLTLWGADQKASVSSQSHYSLIIADGQAGPPSKQDRGHVIEIPIVNDHPNLAHAKIPANVRLTDVTT